MKLRPVFKDILLTFLTEGTVLMAVIFIYRLIAKNFGPQGIGEYSLIRRVISIVQPLILLGVSIGLPRYIAIAKNKSEKILYVKIATLIIIFSNLFFLFIILLLKENFAKIFLGSITNIHLVIPFLVLLIGLNFHVLIYCCFQGQLMTSVFNFLQILNLALIPITILLLKEISLRKTVILMGIGIIFTSLLFFSLFLIKDIIKPFNKHYYKQTLKNLLKYSIPRIPGDFAFMALFSLGPIFVAHLSSIEDVGYLSISQKIVSLAASAIFPLGLILLPKISSLISQGEYNYIKTNIDIIIGFVIHIFIFVCIQLMIFSDIIVKYWLGEKFINAVKIMRIVSISTIFYAFYVSMRSVIDAAEVKPLNTINLLIALSIFLFISVVFFLWKPFSAVINFGIAFDISMICLGILTYFSVRKIYPTNFKKDLSYVLLALLVNLFLAIISIFIKPFLKTKLYLLFIFEFFIIFLYLLILWFFKIAWLREIFQKIKI